MSSEASLRIPPQNLDAERSLLGALLLDNAALEGTVIREHQFYSDAHGRIFAAMQRLQRAGVPVDAVTLAEELNRHGQLEDVGGVGVIVQLMDVVPHSAHAGHYAAIVVAKWMLRQITIATRELTDRCHEGDADAEQILAAAVQRLSALHDGTGSDGLVSLAESCETVLANIKQRQTQDLDSHRVLTGFADLDTHLCGFGESQMIVLAARPGMGKTAFALNIATQVMKAGNAVLFISLEMTHQELTERWLSGETGVNGHNIMSGRLSEQEFYQLEQTAMENCHHQLYFLDNKYSITDITAKARRAYRKYGVRLVIADYLQLVDAEMKRGMLREQAVSSVSRELKRLAMELKVPVLVLSQLNRDLEKRNDKRPQLSDLRESGAIEQDANVVLFLYRPDAYDPEDRPGETEVIIAKNRTGPTGTVRLIWRREFCRFEDFRPFADMDFELFGQPSLSGT